MHMFIVNICTKLLMQLLGMKIGVYHVESFLSVNRILDLHIVRREHKKMNA